MEIGLFFKASISLSDTDWSTLEALAMFSPFSSNIRTVRWSDSGIANIDSSMRKPAALYSLEVRIDLLNSFSLSTSCGWIPNGSEMKWVKLDIGLSTAEEEKIGFLLVAATARRGGGGDILGEGGERESRHSGSRWRRKRARRSGWWGRPRGGGDLAGEPWP
jgi:hypothetical protein